MDGIVNGAVGANSDGEANILSSGGVLANTPYELIPNAPIRYAAMSVNDLAFGAAHHGSDGDFTTRDGFELTGSVVGGIAGAAIGTLVGGVGGYAGGTAGALGGESLGGAIYDGLVDAYTPQPDPAGGSGVTRTSPGSAISPGYGGRFDDGRGLRAGDELNGLDEISERNNTGNRDAGGSGDNTGGSPEEHFPNDPPPGTPPHCPPEEPDLPPDAPFAEPPRRDPLVIDLDGDGIELTPLDGSSTFFDLNVDGFAERTGWVSSDDGLLAFDANGNGIIDNNTELFGDATGFDNGFAQLAQFDSNGDGIISAADDDFESLVIWRDADQDGISDNGELLSLTDTGINSIDLNSIEVDETNQGHVVSDRSTVTFNDGTTRTIEDINFQADVSSSVALLADDFEYNDEALTMPVLWGYGQITSTWVALSNDADLLAQSSDLLEKLAQGDISGFLDGFENFVLNWAGVSDIDSSSRGNFVDAQHLSFLEHAYGTEFNQTGALNGAEEIPTRQSGILIEEQFDTLVARLAGRFMAQSAASSALLSSETLAEVFPNFALHPLFGLSILTTDYSPNNRSLDGNLTAVVAIFQSSIENDTISSLDAARAISLLQDDLSPTPEAFRDLINEAITEAELDTSSDFVLILNQITDALVADGTPNIVSGTVGADTITVDEASFVSGGEGDDTITGSSENDFIVGSQGNDVLNGGAGEDTLLGGEGDDILNGGAGSDIYTVFTGQGDDQIAENSAQYQEVDTLAFEDDITAADVYSTYENGNLFIRFKNADGSITILQEADDDSSAANHQINQFTFTDGTTLDRAEFLAATLGTSGDDAFDGSGENDTFIVRMGQGNDTLSSNSSHYAEVDTITFEAGVTAADVYSTFNGTSLVIGFKNADGTLSVLNYADDDSSASHHQVNQFTFSDGTTLSRSEFLAATLGTSGDDAFNGSGENDTFTIRAGQGDDTVSSNSSHYAEVDTLTFEDGVTATDVYSTYDGVNLVIGFRNADGTLTVLNDADNDSSASHHQINQFSFSDGTTLSREDFLAATLGTDGDDAFDGSGENDTFIVRAGQGNDTISSNSSHYAEVDTLRFEDGVTVSDIYSTYNGENFVIGFKAADGTITILNDAADTSNAQNHQVNQFVFSDGTTLNRQEFMAATLGTSGNDTFNGSGESDTFTLRAGQGDDTIASNSSHYAEVDTLKFEAGITADDIYSTPVGNDLVIGFRDAEGTITILGDTSSASNANLYQINQYVFSDGTTLNRADFLAATAAPLGGADNTVTEILEDYHTNQIILNGTDAADTLTANQATFLFGGDGDDVLNGSSANDFLVGQAGNDTLAGGYGSDTYYIASGQGDDLITETSTGYRQADVLRFAAGISVDDVYSIYEGANLKISFKNADGSVTIVNDGSDSSSADKYQVDTFVFEDGTTLNRQEFMAATLGTSGDDAFNNSGENDTFIVRAGQGDDTLTSNTSHYREVDTVTFEDGVTVDDVYSSFNGSSFVIGFKNADGTLSILNFADDDSSASRHQVNQFTFSDGTTLTRQEFMAATLGTAGDDAFNGSGENDTFIVRAGQGNDTLSSNSSHYREVDTITFEDGVTAADVYSTYSGSSLVIGFKNADGTLSILNYADDDSSASKHQVNQFTFSDGTTLNRADFLAATLGTSGDDAFNGSGENDTFIVRAGQGDDTLSSNSSHYAEVDTLRFEDGVTAADVYSTYNGSSLVIGFKNADGTLSILHDADDDSSASKHQVNQFSFSDGTTLSRVDFLAATLGTAGDDAFNGSGENDTFAVRSGQGNDTLSSNSSHYAEVDKLTFEDGLTINDVFTFREDVDGNGTDDLVIGFENGTGSFSILNAYSTSSSAHRYQVDTIEFADGSTHTYDDFVAETLDQTKADDFLF